MRKNMRLWKKSKLRIEKCHSLLHLRFMTDIPTYTKKWNKLKDVSIDRFENA